MAWWWAIRAPGRDVSPRAQAAPQPTEASTELKEPEVVPADDVQRDAIVAPTEETVILRPPAAEFDDSAAATLLIQVRADATGDPIQGVRIVLWPEPKQGVFFVVNGETSSERFGRSPLSDEQGRARIVVPAGRTFRLNTSSDVAGPATLEISPLAVGEQREIEVRVPMGTDLRFVARVVDDESGDALPDARIRVGSIGEIGKGSEDPETGGRSSIQVDQDGCFELDLESWKHRIARVEAPGYAWTPVVPTVGHETRATAREVRLRRAAVVEVHVVARGPLTLEGILVELSTEHYNLNGLASMGQFVFSSEPVRWSALTDAFGRCRIEGLPPGVALDSSARPRGESTVRLPGVPSLAPGETRAIEIELGGGATLSGWVRDVDGAPVQRAEVWLMARSAAAGTCMRSYEQDSAQVERTDADGRFSYLDVPDGEWLVGCSADGPFAPHSASVMVTNGRADREPSLIADASLFIRGRVLDYAGRPVEAHVFAGGVESGCFADGKSEADGSFALGPLVRGSYVLSAMPSGRAEGEPLTRSEPLTVSAGTSDVILELQRGGVISGRVVDPLTGRGVAMDIQAASLGDAQAGGGRWQLMSSQDGTFRFDGLAAGTYVVSARTTGVQFAFSDAIELAAGHEVGDLTLTLEPGARLRVRYDGAAPYGQLRIHRGGIPVAADGIQRGSDDTFVVPVGTLTVECSEHMGTHKSTRSKSVEVAAGGLATVEFGRED